MIIEWTQTRVKVIPIVKGNVNVSSVTLLPGCNEVDKNVWEQARKHVLDQIKTGVIKEIETQVVDKEKIIKPASGTGKNRVPAEKETVKVLKAKEFNKLEAQKALEILKNTYNTKTLESWQKKEHRDEIRAALANQLELVEKHGTEAKNKKKTED